MAQWLVHFSAHPQPMQEYRQLAGGGNDGSFLSSLATAFG